MAPEPPDLNSATGRIGFMADKLDVLIDIFRGSIPGITDVEIISALGGKVADVLMARVPDHAKRLAILETMRASIARTVARQKGN